MFRLEVLIHHQRPGAWGEHLKRFQELDNRVFIISIQGFKLLSLLQGFAGMSQNCLTHCCELAMMEIRRLIGSSPQTPRQEFSVSIAEFGSPWCLVLIQRLAWIARLTDIVQFEVGIRCHPYCVRTLWIDCQAW